MSKDKGPDIKILKELMTEAGTAAAENCEGVSRVIDFKTDVDTEKSETEITVYIDVIFGCKIPDVSWNVQSAVKTAVRNAAGYDAKKVNIHIQGVIKSDGSVKDI